MKKMFNKILTGAVLLGMGLLGINEASAQNFQMQTAGATYNATCNAVIKMKNASSQFVVDVANDFGQSTDVIDGIVDWASASGTQQVQAFYYEKMVVSGGGTKNLASGIFIMGLSNGCTPLAGYTNTNDYPYWVTGGTLVYNGTFNYGGGTLATDVQNIWPNSATGDPDYTNLNLTGSGDKIVMATDAVVVAGTLSSDAGTNLAIAGDLTLGSGASTINGTLDLNGPNAGDPANLNIGTNTLTLNQAVTVGIGAINSSGTDGDVIIGSTGSLALTDNNSVLNFSGTELVVTGLISNGGNGTNLNFDCTSIVTYNGTQAPQLILPTIATNPYGNLNLAGGNKQPQNYTYDNVYVCSAFDLQNGNLDMATNSGTLFMKAGNATYSALAEVVGKMARTPDFVTPTVITDGTYSYNNAATAVTFGGGAANPKQLTLNVTPGSTAFNGYVAASDVKRSITLTHDATADFGLAVQAGYRFEEGPLGNPSYFGGVYTQPSIRMYEGFADNTSEKIGTGVQPTRVSAVAATSLGSVLLTGLKYTATSTNSNDIDKFYSSNNIILRAGPTTFYTVNSGRWTNPNTWDEGALPAAIDDAEVRHSVYVGIDGPFINTTGGADDTYANNTKAELAHYGTNAAANTITIASGYTNAALIIGNEDNGNGYVFHTAKADGTSFSNQNATSSTPTVTTIGAKASYVAANPGFNGLFLTTYGNTGAQLSAFGTYQLLNVGAINNMGIIEIGE